MDYRTENKSSYLRAKTHLDEIIEQIRSKDVPLEKALDLYEEAIRIGNSCADLIDKTDFSLEELEAFNAARVDESEDESEDENEGENEGESENLADADDDAEAQDSSSTTDNAEDTDDKDQPA